MRQATDLEYRNIDSRRSCRTLCDPHASGVVLVRHKGFARAVPTTVAVVLPLTPKEPVRFRQRWQRFAHEQFMFEPTVQTLDIGVLPRWPRLEKPLATVPPGDPSSEELGEDFRPKR